MRWDFWRRAIQIGIFDWPVPTYVPWRAFCGWCCESIGYRDGGQDGSFALAAFLVRSPLTNRIKEWTQMSVAGITGQNFNETQFILLLLFYVFIVFFKRIIWTSLSPLNHWLVTTIWRNNVASGPPLFAACELRKRCYQQWNMCRLSYKDTPMTLT